MALLLKLRSALVHRLYNHWSDFFVLGYRGQDGLERCLVTFGQQRTGPTPVNYCQGGGPDVKPAQTRPTYRPGTGLTYLSSTLNLLSTENTPLTVCARIPAKSLSPCDATTPTSVTCPL